MSILHSYMISHVGAAIDKNHVAEEFERFIHDIEKEHGISRQEIARHGVYFSHETSTHASNDSSCAANEVSTYVSIYFEKSSYHSS